jgi:hypothetical protein
MYIKKLLLFCFLALATILYSSDNQKGLPSSGGDKNETKVIGNDKIDADMRKWYRDQNRKNELVTSLTASFDPNLAPGQGKIIRDAIIDRCKKEGFEGIAAQVRLMCIANGFKE